MPKTFPRRALLALGLAPMVTLAGCVVATAQPRNPYPAVPPARYEVIPPPPGPQAIWVWEPGHWHWNGGGYVWVRGHYVRRRPNWVRWVPGHWALERGAWVWVPGHWT